MRSTPGPPRTCAPTQALQTCRMPELAEVEYFRKQWNPGLHRKILQVDWHAHKRVFRGQKANTFISFLTGKTLTSSHAHGKQMLFRVGRSGWLGVHLGMTGKLFTQPANDPPGPHDHLVLRTRLLSLVYQDPRLFGRIRLHASPTPPDWWSRLPPAIHSPQFDVPRLQDICRRRGKTPLKALLLRQECFPGIGNWMADEVLWQSRLHPQTMGGSLNKLHVRRLHTHLRKICRQAMQTIGKNWSDPPKSWLFSHRWKPGGHCPRCRRFLARAQIGGRTTCWCPACQPRLPRRTRSA